MKKTGKNLEGYVEYVYSQLLNLNDYEETVVSTNVTIKGQSGATNEFDVYYQFMHLNIECRVAIECKEWDRPVSVKEVRDFVYKIHDVGMGNMIGLMISKCGYQDGSQKVADANGIKLLQSKDLPTINEILLASIKKGFLPNSKCVGDPFWTIMEGDNDEVTGSYLSLSKNKDEKPLIPLFYSQNMAKKVLANIADKDKYVIRGVSQYQLRGLMAFEKLGDPQFALFYLPFLNSNKHEIPSIVMNAQEIRDNYLR